MTLTGSTISDNAAASGGGIGTGGITFFYYPFGTGRHFYPSDVTITNSSVTGNTATQAGGGIENIGLLSISGSIIADNSAASGAGLITPILAS